MNGGGQFTPAFLDEIRARISVSTIVGRKVKLERRGREFVGLSPFSHEKTPSFTVNDEKGFYHCFSTQEHGDIFTFVMKTQQLSFPEAVELLAEEAGVEMPERSAADRQKAAKIAALQPIVEAACLLYEEALWAPEGAKALEYLRSRGLKDETIRRFRLGYAPSGNHVLDRLTKRGTAEYMLLETRMVLPGKDGGAPFDFFRDRVMFPIMDMRGRVVAFGGRIMGEGEPKYLNSSDTPLFHKGSLLYGLSLAREMAGAKKQIIAVEGYMDVIAMSQAGYENTVAPLGTAITEAQLALMWRYDAEPVLCLDGDKAGIAAARRAADRALPVLKPGFGLLIARMPAGQDPDDICTGDDPGALSAILAQAKPLSEVVWEQLLADHPTNTPERRAGFTKAAADKAKTIKDETVQKAFRAHFRAEMEKLFGAEEGRDALADSQREGEGPGKADRYHDEYHDGPTVEDIVGHHCPLTFLGHSMRFNGLNGGGRTKVWHILDTNGQLESLTASHLRSHAIISGLFFGNVAWLEEMASNKTAEGAELPGDKATWKLNKIVSLIQRACEAAGFFDPENAVRGPGVWPYGVVKEWPRRDPRIVVHTGAAVWVVDTGKKPAEFKRYAGGVRIGEYVYVRTRAEDALSTVALDNADAARLIRFYEAWNWKDKTVALKIRLVGFLLFGWLAAAGIAALIHRRPTLFLRGATTAGKSAVCDHHEWMLGTAARRMENNTMTGVRLAFVEPQPVRAIIYNEANKSEHVNTQEQLRQVLNVALYCYSSGEGNQYRGPGGISGSINAMFMFSAGRPPALNDDDANRMVLLNMDLLPQMGPEAKTDFLTWQEDLKGLGPALRRRMVERWGDYASCFAIFEKALFANGYQGREADTFGTLMSCAWLGSQSGLPEYAQAHELAGAVSTSMLAQAAEEADPEWKRCWTQLTTSSVVWFNDRRTTVGELIKTAIAVNDRETARRDLKANGIAVVKRKSKVEEAAHEADASQPPPVPREWIAVSYRHRGLEEIFKGTAWRDSKWTEALAQMPGAEKNHPANFAGQERGKAVLIPIEEIKRKIGDEVYDDDPEAEERAREASQVK